MTGELRLRPLRTDDEAQARQAHAELAGDDFAFLLDWNPEEPWATYLDRLDRYRRGTDLPDDRVPATFLVAETSGTIVGRVSIRHELNAYLAAVGGHIGYGIRPGRRRNGYATEVLRQALVIARAEGVDRVLLTCDTDNAGSAMVIERCGGVFDGVREDPHGAPTRRYWIT